MAIYTGAEIAIRLLERQGIKIIAGIPGGPILPFYDALSQANSITHILARHEQGAGFIAQGMARSTGLPAVCVASSGPGATNLLTAIADAKLDSIPLIAITGQVPQYMIGTDAFQEVDTYGLSLPITKHSFLAKSASELLEVIPRAFSIAMSGRPGPVLIDLPKDVQLEKLEINEWPEPGHASETPKLETSSLEIAAALINTSKRPILYLGGGIVHSDAAEAAKALAEKSSIPTVMMLMGLGVLPIDHELSLGMLGMHGARCTNLALDEADLLIVIGARLDDRATGKIEQFCPRAKLIHIDIDHSEIGKLRMPHLSIVADASNTLKQLSPLINRDERASWTLRISTLKASYPLLKPGGLDDITTHFGLINAVSKSLGDDAIIVTDVGQHQMWVAQAYPLRKSRHWLTSGGLGTMGFGLPAAIGAALANPDKTIVCFTGDGSILMNIQEFATAAELNVNIKIVLMNNRSLGMVHQQQSMFFGKRIYASKYQMAPMFTKVAQGFGINTVDLDTEELPELALEKALTAYGPTLIHSSIDIEQQVLPIVPPGAANIEMIG